MRARSVHSDEYRLLATRLKQVRRSNKVKQSAVAILLGRPRTFPSKVETAERELNVVELFDYLVAIDADVTEFVLTLWSDIRQMREENQSSSRTIDLDEEKGNSS